MPNPTFVHEHSRIAEFVSDSSNELCRYEVHSDNFVSFKLLPDQSESFKIYVPVSRTVFYFNAVKNGY